MKASEVYAEQRRRVSELARSLGEQELQTRVPGCPEWVVRDVVAHLAGLSADLAAGRIDGAGTRPWTAKQVADRQGRSVEELLAEWDEHAPGVQGALDELGTAGWRVAFDATMHEDDMREALGLPLGDAPSHATVLDGMVALAAGKAERAGLPPVRFVAGERSWGPQDAAVSMTVPDAGELGRALGGRRDAQALATYDWQGDAAPYVPHLSLFAPG